MGLALPLMCGACILYWFFGQYLPAPFNHRGYDFDQIITHLSYGTEGFYGVPIYVSATYIFLFILFGSFLERAGMIQLFTDVSLGLFGGTRGGPAKVAVFASGMMGTISGSGVANVVTVGQFTIPLMIRFGYRRAFAAGVEATASMGGQIMPPVMGAVAFIMAETLGVDYSVIVKAAVIPAILYFASAFWMVHLEAGKHGLVGMKRSEIPSAWKALVARWYLVLPLAALVYMLFEGFTPLYAGSIGLALTVALILGASITLGFSSAVVRYVFWIGLALVVAAVSRNGLEIVPVAGVVGVLVLIAAITRGGRATLAACRDSLADSAKSALTVGMACAIVGSIIGMMTQTGVGTIFGGWIIGLGAKSLFLALVMTMLLSILLGTGIPTIPTYIITAALAAPALAKLGVPLIVSHMFAFYYGIMADLSPPVALAALAAAPIARENPDKIGWEAMRIALAGYVIPFIFVYSPALMLQAGDPDGRATRILRRGGVCDLQGAGRDRPVRHGRDRLPVHAADAGWSAPSAFVAALCLLGDFRFSDTAGFRADGRHACSGNGGSASAPRWRRLEPLPDLGRRREDAVGRRLHACLDPFGREDRVAGRLARHPAGTRTGAGAGQGLRRRHGAAAGGAAGRRLVSMAAEARADAGSGAGQFRRRRRMAAVQ